MPTKPFIKWVGGKSQLLADIRSKYPKELGRTINRYCEPFIGGGAVLLDIISQYNLDEVLINDINQELITTYSQIKLNVNPLIDELLSLQDTYWQLNTEDRKVFYYQKRERFNDLKINGDEQANLEKASLFIFLNKTCFNGLFRVNKRGLFNVPMGSYKKPLICDIDNLKNISGLLQNVKIQCGDYKECASFINAKTFVYIDPPYRPLTTTANFTSYAETDFSDNEQIALGQFVDYINNVGAKVVVSNSDPKNSNSQDDFFDNLYKAYDIQRVSATRMINCNSENRGSISELLISNY